MTIFAPTRGLKRAQDRLICLLDRLVGDLGWRYQAHENGLHQAALGAGPLG